MKMLYLDSATTTNAIEKMGGKQKSMDYLRELVERGHVTLECSENLFDNPLALEYPDIFISWMKKGLLSLRFFFGPQVKVKEIRRAAMVAGQDPDKAVEADRIESKEAAFLQMVHKPFIWQTWKESKDGQSVNVQTDWTNDTRTMEQLIKTMPKWQNRLKLYKAMVKHGVASGEWERGPFNINQNFFTEEELEDLGLTKTTMKNRTAAFAAMDAANEKAKAAGKAIPYPSERYARYTLEVALGGLISQRNCDGAAFVDELYAA